MRTVIICAVLALLFPRLVLADITTGLVGHWPFSGNAQDASGNGNHGAPNSAVALTADRFGDANSAYLFDGISSRIDIPSSSSLESPVAEITMAAWIRRDGWGMVGNLYNPILTKSTGTANAFQYRFIITPTGLGSAYNDWFTGVSAPSTYAVGDWYHVASTFAASTVRSYINGVPVHTGSLATTLIADSRPLSIGSDTPGVLEIFFGAIDDVRIYNRALSDADIAELAGVPTGTSLVGTNAVWLGEAYPNPVQASTLIPFRLSIDTPVTIEVVDARGRRVRSLISGWLTPGRHDVPWDGRDASGQFVASGVYFYHAAAPGIRLTRKAVVLR